MTKISPEIQKITKIPPKQKKNDWNTPWKKKDQNTPEVHTITKYPQNLKDYQSTPET